VLVLAGFDAYDEPVSQRILYCPPRVVVPEIYCGVSVARFEKSVQLTMIENLTWPASRVTLVVFPIASYVYAVFAAELNLAQARGNELLALVQVYQALGGGWQR